MHDHTVVLKAKEDFANWVDVAADELDVENGSNEAGMPAVQWSIKEQTEWLQECLPQYMIEHLKDKDYSHFWPAVYEEWFKKFPEEAVMFSGIPADTLLAEQNTAIEEAQAKWKIQLQTWFHWHAGMSKKNRTLKKKLIVFNDMLQPKKHAKSEAEIYSDIYYDEHVKPLVKAEEEAGNVTSGKHITLGHKFSKELLEDEDEDVKTQICKMYEQQRKTHNKSTEKLQHILDDDEEGDCMLDAEAITQYVFTLILLEIQ
ncbi:hypothetical protein BDR06DRAFT_1011280 [Suillus hirtellus]|nr:hypothetical protein BDR06DRAFT_1011280 [Suillus hirtellus]